MPIPIRVLRVRSTLPPGLEPLAELATNLRWSWDASTREVFRYADPQLWEQVGHNPTRLLGRLSLDRLTELAEDAGYRRRIREASQSLWQAVVQPSWAQSGRASPPTAYFSPEFALTSAMQTYSGGLGVLAGDYLKAASDLGLDLVGVGLLYRRGYFRQSLDAEGWQQEHYPDLDPIDLPLRPVATRDGEPALVRLQLAERTVACRVWRLDVGRVPLLLLDTDVEGNATEDRSVTDKLYGGDLEHRLRQELVLGVAGVRALDLAVSAGVLDVPPRVFHSNEGHAGFLELERVRSLVVDEGLTFDEAIESARAGGLFTTHTPVPAGIDVFPRELMDRYFREFAAECGISLDRLMALGQPPGSGSSGDFNMAIMGLRLSGAANGVSRLHGRVARDMFSFLWPGCMRDEIPIGAVTNGVHAATWVGPEMAAAYDERLPAGWAVDPAAWQEVSGIDDETLWAARSRARRRLVLEARSRLAGQRERRGHHADTAELDMILDPDALTVGFARRFAEYKRGALLLRQPERLRALLTSDERPVQLVFAGKAHPRDHLGKDLIRQLVEFSRDPALRRRMVFLPDYDMDLAAALVQGADLWLNTPRRPHEACGTSGQKAVLNAALHCSTLDGWWDEMADGENGFCIGTPTAHADSAQQDAIETEALYELLEDTIVPMFYERSVEGIPVRWVNRVRRSLGTLGPQVLAARMIREYEMDYYRPLAARADRLTADRHARACDLAAWRHRMTEEWEAVGVHEVVVDDAVAELGETREIDVLVELGRLSPTDVRVELLYGLVAADGELDAPAAQVLEPVGVEGPCHRYRGTVACGVPGDHGLTARVVADHPDLWSSADTGLVAWARAAGESEGEA